VKEQKGNYGEYVIRHLKATRGGETREVTHLHYTEFPDRGIPKCVPSLLDMIELMRELQPANYPEAPPVVVHCRPVLRRCQTIDKVGQLLWAWILLADKIGQLYRSSDIPFRITLGLCAHNKLLYIVDLGGWLYTEIFVKKTYQFKT